MAAIAGATSGMPLAIAKLFVEEGAYVFITGRRPKELDEAVYAIGKNVIGIPDFQSSDLHFLHIKELFVVHKDNGEWKITHYMGNHN